MGKNGKRYINIDLHGLPYKGQGRLPWIKTLLKALLKALSESNSKYIFYCGHRETIRFENLLWTINWLKSIENEEKSKVRNQSIAKSTFFHLFTCCTWKISKEVPNDIKIKWLNWIFIFMSCDGSFSFQYTKLTR